MTDTGTVADKAVDVAALEDLFSEEHPKCSSWKKLTAKPRDLCPNDATHVIRCWCGVGRAYMCDACLRLVSHGSWFRRLRAGEPWVVFGDACGHEVELSKCVIYPI